MRRDRCWPSATPSTRATRSSSSSRPTSSRRGRRGAESGRPRPHPPRPGRGHRAPRASTLDERRPDAVAKRRAQDRPAHGARERRRPRATPAASSSTARSSSRPAQPRTPIEELIADVPGRRHGRRHRHRQRQRVRPDEAARCVVMAYDYTVLAGTQGRSTTARQDRMFELAARHELPLVVCSPRAAAAGPGDTDQALIRSRASTCPPSAPSPRSRGLVPLVGIVIGPLLRRQRRAARLLRRDHRHAQDSNIGMGGPGHDRGRRPRRVRARGGRPGRRCRCPTASSTSRSTTRPRRSPSPSSTCRTSRAPLPTWERADQRLLRHVRPGEPAARLRRAQR